MANMVKPFLATEAPSSSMLCVHTRKACDKITVSKPQRSPQGHFNDHVIQVDVASMSRKETLLDLEDHSVGWWLSSQSGTIWETNLLFLDIDGTVSQM